MITLRYIVPRSVLAFEYPFITCLINRSRSWQKNPSVLWDFSVIYAYGLVFLFLGTSKSWNYPLHLNKHCEHGDLSCQHCISHMYNMCMLIKQQILVRSKAHLVRTNISGLQKSRQSLGGRQKLNFLHLFAAPLGMIWIVTAQIE